MLQRATESFRNATALALRMTLDAGMDFRSAHRRVGHAVTEALARGMTSLEELAHEEARIFEVSLEGMDPASCVIRNRYGGGPAPENIRALLGILCEKWSLRRRQLLDQASRWTAAEGNFERAVRAFFGS
jgi:argininosuccinate lyase